MATDYQSIVDGGLSNVVDNVDKFIEYPGQDKLDSLTGLSDTFSASSAFGYDSINDLDTSSFSESEQIRITDSLTRMDTMSDANRDCMEQVGGYIADALSNFMPTTSILDAFKSNNGITDCEYGLGVLLASETHLDDYLGAFDTSVSSNTFGRMVNNIAGGIDSTLDFLSDLDIIDAALDALEGACEILKAAMLALVAIAAGILDAALAFLSNLGLLGRLSLGECVEEFLPEGASAVMDQINNQLAGIESIPSIASDTIIDNVVSLSPLSSSSSRSSTNWIDSSTVINKTKSSGNTQLYDRMSNKINNFSSSSSSSSGSGYTSSSLSGSPAASVSRIVSYTRESLTYNPITRNWE